MKESEQKKLIHQGDWDCLIVLDACRHDFFKRNYEDYLPGDLQKIKSATGGTSPWIRKIFGDKEFKNIVYISGNPHIASNMKIDDFLGGEHFYKVMDVWDWGWDSNWGTVPPERVSKAARNARLSYPSKRLVIHFMQPHGPFPQLKIRNVRENPLGKIRSLIDEWGIEFMGRRKFRRLKESVWKPLLWPFWKKFEGQQQGILGTEAIAKKYGVDTLRRLYEGNLKLALKEIKNLIKFLPGKIIVTADHGEALGGKEGFGHRKMEVPWLEIEGESKGDLDALEQKRISECVGDLKRNGKI